MEPELTRVVGCPLCGRFTGPGAGPAAITESGFTAGRCEPCGLLFVSPRPSESAVLAVYEHDASQTAARVHVAKSKDPVAVAHARHLLGLLQPHLAPHTRRTGKARLLEVGAGGGVLLGEARSRGFDVAAIEPNPVLAAFMSDRGIACEPLLLPPSPTGLGPASFPGREFDAIVHCNVLSHFDDPLASLTAMASRLAPGGILMVETGNFADVDPRFHALIRATERFQLPEHLTFFGERSLDALVRAAGFEPLVCHRYSRVPEKLGPTVLRALGLGGLTNRLRFWLKYRVGAWFPKRGRPLTLVLVARLAAQGPAP